ncbi:hypothetical protein COLO4_19683 [Corchorus olitorius]|uniref:Uncharacterized protein n=1 Tax=Corchorus olitorius TaxID=93759 RepID=A0A1R3J409_9ROSI|nr:hypothetical protein COLO4_19683 [Corchorus olitorius]
MALDLCSSPSKTQNPSSDSVESFGSNLGEEEPETFNGVVEQFPMMSPEY